MNGTVVKNQLIFDYAAGSLGISKSIFASTYLYLNSRASKINKTFESMLGNNLFETDGVETSKLSYKDCINSNIINEANPKKNQSPINKLVGPFEDIKWKQIYKGFQEFSLDLDDEDDLKLIKMEPGSSVPLHSHGGKEFILVLEGSFRDEYGEYSTGDIQINDQKIMHTPIACNDKGCVCLTITEKEVIFFGKYGSFLNLFTFIKSFFK